MRAAQVAIIGAGPAGMALAYQLAKHGTQVCVYEASPYVGGLTRSFILWNERVDLGPHIFAGYSPEALALWLEVVGAEHRWLQRDTRIAIRGRRYRYPLQPLELLAGLGLTGAGKAALSLCASRLRPVGTVGSSKHFFIQRFGSYLYELFFRPYCEKLWGIDPDQVDVAFCAGLVGDISIVGTMLRRLRGELSRREVSLQTRFPYAHGGAGAFCERAAERLRALGGRVLLDSPVTNLLRERERVVGVVTQQGSQRYDWVVSSMPLPLLVRALGSVPQPVSQALARLRFRSTILVYLRVCQLGRAILPHLWMYASDGVTAGRITNFATWHGDPKKPVQLLALEYYCTERDALWSADDLTLSELATAELIKVLPHVQRHAVLASHVLRLRNTHPLYYRGFRADVASVAEHVQGFAGLTVLGRAGNYDYDSQASALERGSELAALIRQQLAHAAPASIAI